MRDNYNRLYELYALIDMLYSAEFSGGVTREEILQRFYDWKTRTLERMMNVVKTLFGDSLKLDYRMGYDNKRYRTYRLESIDTKKLHQPSFMPEELAALKTAAETLRTNTELSRNLDIVTDKLRRIAKTAHKNVDDILDASSVVMMPRPQMKYDPDVMDKIQNAILCFNQIEMMYKGKKRVVCPLGILHGMHKNYLVASKPEHETEPFLYICSAIEDVVILDSVFNRGDFDMREYAKKSFGVYNDKDGGYDVEWRVAPDAAEDAAKYTFHPTQELTTNEDGSLTVRFHAAGLREMAWHLFTWGGKIVPVAPAELIDEYRRCLDLATASLTQN